MTPPESATLQNTEFDIEKASNALPGPLWLQNRRRDFVEKNSVIEWPSSSQELWRYTKIDDFDINNYRPVGVEDIGKPGEQTSPGGGIVAAEAGKHSGLIVIHDGRVVHQSLDPELVSKGVIVEALEEVDQEQSEELLKYLGKLSDDTQDAFTLLNEMLNTGGVYINVPVSVVVPSPIVIVHWVDGDKIAAFPRSIVIAKENSSVSVIERFESSDQEILISSITEVFVQQNAQVKYLTSQEEGKNTTHIALHRSSLDRDARFESSTIALGGKYARHRGEVVLQGQGATSDVMAVYYGDENQMLDFRTLQDHNAEHTHSNLLFKGAVEDNAKSVYSGLIHIRPQGQHSKAFQTNKNLVLDHGAQAESIPNLKIEANEVQCSHGSTVGPIDEEQMYYLGTRGVSPEDAEKMIVLGFFEDVFARLSIPALIAPLRRSVNEKISALEEKRATDD